MKNAMRLSLILCFALAALVSPVHAKTTIATSNGDWTAAIWDNGAPSNGDHVVIQSGISVTLSSSTDWLASCTNNGTLTFTNWTTALQATNVYVNGTITHVPCDTNAAPGVTNRVYIRCVDLTVNAGKAISGSAKGFGPFQGPGAGVTRGDNAVASGAGHGGAGGASVGGPAGGGTYGSAGAPSLPGSGGGKTNNLTGTGYGGGVIRIEAGGKVTVDGAIAADGEILPTYGLGGGAGGSLYITCRTIAGSGTLTADGGANIEGNHHGGGGGGGRIAVSFTNDWFTGTHSAAGGQGYSYGAAGTISWQLAGSPPFLSVDGLPADYDTPSPHFYGSNAIPAGSSVTNNIDGIVDVDTGWRVHLARWSLLTNGVEITSGASTQAVFTMPTVNATLRYEWTNVFELAISAALNGSVSTGDNGWYTNGVAVEIDATADGGYTFSQWTGDAFTGGYQSNPLTLNMDQPRTLVGHFGINGGTTKTLSSSGDWETPGNWTPAGMPGPLDTVVIPSGSATLSNPTWVGNVTNSGTITFSGWMSALAASDVLNNGTITHVSCSALGAPTSRVYIVCNDLTVPATKSINADNGGYDQQQGPGAGGTSGFGTGGGGGHGGEGGHGNTNHGGSDGGPTYGSSNAPVGPGSGGGHLSGGDGGGSVWIEASGTVTVNGSVTANGQDTGFGQGGGSGGAIFLSCITIAGNGTVQAKGGYDMNPNHYGGPGGGGRIAVYYENHPFVGSYSVDPGLWQSGWINTAGATGTLVLVSTATNPILTVAGAPSTVGSPVPYGYGESAVPAGKVITNIVASPLNEAGGQRDTLASWDVRTNGTLITSGISTQAVFTMQTTNTTLTYYWTNEYQLTVLQGPYGTATTNKSGWYTNGLSVQLSATPSNAYSFLQWTGDVPAGGYTNNPLDVTMDRTRTIKAHFVTNASLSRTWTGTGGWDEWNNWSPLGLPGHGDDVMIESGNATLADPMTIADLVVSNGATLTFGGGWDTELAAQSVTVDGTIALEPSTTDVGPSNRIHIVCLNMTVPAGSVVTADDAGFMPENGPGRGGSDYGFGSAGGGGYGGAGGHGFYAHPGATGGPTYGSSNAPVGPGSGGGYNTGASGGGAIRLEIARSLTLEGTVTADGQNSPSWNAGGGSGGSIHIDCRRLLGGGTLSADGGDGGPGVNGYGGAGGGGRIAVWRVPRFGVFSGTAGVTGGAPGNNSSPGQDGTVVWGEVYVPPGTVFMLR